MGKYTAAILSLFVYQMVLGATYHLDRPDGSQITYYLEEPKHSPKFPILILLQGSQCTSVDGRYDEFATLFTQIFQTAFLTVEKPGFPSKEEGCPKEYLENNTIDQRIEDLHTVFAELRSSKPEWNRELILMGGSEGATLGGLIAHQIPEARYLMLAAGGGGMTFAEELLFLQRKKMTNEGASQGEVDVAQEKMRAKFEEIKGNPTPDKSWYGETNTYKWWASILFRDLRESLASVKVPIYIVQGTEDWSVPVESSDQLASFLQSQNKKVTYVRREGLSHNFQHTNGQSYSKYVYAASVFWLMVQEDQELRFKLMEMIKDDPNSPFLPELWQKIAQIDQRNTMATKVLMSRTGFPLISTHGHQANRDGWLIAQHADRDVAFQKEVLAILETALKQNDTHPPDVAYLTDRVMVNERVQNGQAAKQLFGTQGRLKDKCWEPWSMQDHRTVDERRARYDLGPLADYVRLMNELYGKPECL